MKRGAWRGTEDGRAGQIAWSILEARAAHRSDYPIITLSG